MCSHSPFSQHFSLDPAGIFDLDATRRDISTLAYTLTLPWTFGSTRLGHFIAFPSVPKLDSARLALLVPIHLYSPGLGRLNHLLDLDYLPSRGTRTNNEQSRATVSWTWIPRPIPTHHPLPPKRAKHTYTFPCTLSLSLFSQFSIFSHVHRPRPPPDSCPSVRLARLVSSSQARIFDVASSSTQDRIVTIYTVLTTSKFRF